MEAEQVLLTTMPEAALEMIHLSLAQVFLQLPRLVAEVADRHQVSAQGVTEAPVVAVVLVARLVQLTLPLTLPPPTVVTTVVAVAVWTTVLVALQRGLKTAASAQLESSTLPVTQGVFQALTRGTYNESLYPY